MYLVTLRDKIYLRGERVTVADESRLPVGINRGNRSYNGCARRETLTRLKKSRGNPPRSAVPPQLNARQSKQQRRASLYATTLSRSSPRGITPTRSFPSFNPISGSSTHCASPSTRDNPVKHARHGGGHHGAASTQRAQPPRNPDCACTPCTLRYCYFLFSIESLCSRCKRTTPVAVLVRCVPVQPPPRGSRSHPRERSLPRRPKKEESRCEEWGSPAHRRKWGRLASEGVAGNAVVEGRA